MKHLLAALFFLSVVACVNATTITATNITDLSGKKVAAAKLCFAAVDASGIAIGYRSGTAQIVPVKKCGLVSNGALQSDFTVIDSASTVPTNVRYHITLTSTLNTTSVIRDFGTTTITGTTWTLDSFDLNATALPALYTNSQTTGDLKVNGDLNASGNQTVSGKMTANAVVAKNIGLSVIADQYTSATDCTAKTLAAKSAMATAGVAGTISIGNACGTATSAGIDLGSSPLDLSSGTYSMKISQPGVYIVHQPITLGKDGSALFGSIPMASNGAAITLKEADGANLPYLISMASGSTLANLKIDCNKDNNPTAQDCVLVSDANRVHIHNVTIQHATRDNLHVTNTMYPAVQPSYAYAVGDIASCNNGAIYRMQVTVAGTSDTTYPSCPQTTGATMTWGGATFINLGTILDGTSGSGYLGPNVLMQGAGRDDMFTERNADWIIDAQVEFEQAGRDGFHCEDCATYRFSNDDFGANQRYGFYAAVVNAQCASGTPTMGHIIKGSQFGGNAKSGTGGDIYNAGSAFTGPGFCSGVGEHQYAGGNIIVGNSFIGLGTTSTSVDSVTLVDAGGNTLAGNVWGFLPWAARFNYLVNSSFSTLTGIARQGQHISGNTTIKTFSGPIYQANQGSTPFSLTSGVDVASAITSAGTLTDWMNRVISGTLTVGGTVTLPNGGGCYGGATARVGLSFTDGSGNPWSALCLSSGNVMSLFSPNGFYLTPVATDTGGYNGAPRSVAFWPGNFNLSANMSFNMGDMSGSNHVVIPANTEGAKGSSSGGQNVQMTDSTAAAGYLPMWNSDMSLGRSGISTDASGNMKSSAGTTHAILDKNGYKTGWTVQGTDGNLVFFSTDSSGNSVNIFSIYSGQDNQPVYLHKAVMANGSTATTQSSGDSSTLLATDAFVATAVGSKAAISSTTPTVNAGVCWKTATTLGTCTAGTWPNCTQCN